MPRHLPAPRRPRAVAAAVLLAALTVTGCGSDGSKDADRSGDRTVRRVGDDYDTIQDAVDAAQPGDLVLIPPGTYEEAVKVTTPRLVIRGTDRNKVVLDGADGDLLNGFEISADQVAVENLTVRDFAINGVLFTGSGSYRDDPQTGPVGWRASYVTAANNGLYGLYAFGTGAGQFDHNYASGHPDSGIYVGQCRDCGALVNDNVAEHNAIGYENTNASGVTVARNTWRANRVGMTTNSGDQEQLAPQAGGTIVANLVADNDDPDTPETEGGFGVGIALAGGSKNVVRNNVVTGHPGAGIVLTDQDGYLPLTNQVRGNRLTKNRVDLALFSSDGNAPGDGGNCFADNDATATVPADLSTALACGRDPGPLTATALGLPEAPDGMDLDDRKDPPAQPGMPGADDLERWTFPLKKPVAMDLVGLTAPTG